MATLISVAVLAGGQSRRMGHDKAWLQVGNRPVIERVLQQVAPLTDDLFIGANTPEKYTHLGWPVVPDIYPDKAALGGIFTAIHTARHPYVLVVACDMPFLNQAMLQHLISLAPTADVVAPLINPPQPETLHTIYSKTCLPAIEARLQANQLRVIGFFDQVKVRYVERDEVARFDSDFYAFINMNTPEDWQRVQTIADHLDNRQ